MPSAGVNMEQFHVPGDLEEARRIQADIRRRIEDDMDFFGKSPALVAGTGTSYGISSAYTAVVLVGYPRLDFFLRVEAKGAIEFPYVPGYFSFREIPPILEAFSLLPYPPDLILVHGHGYAHPRRTGLATHLGHLLKIASIGIAGRKMAGMQAREPGESRGDSSPVMMERERVGTMLRTREGSAPVVVSPGYRTTRAQAEEITLACCRDSRFPLPLVLADRAAALMRRRCEG
ncbi:MAG: Endonuclease V [Methanoregulaceae archaeon PtaB.Bin056]|nr:MAG: Endonuclease V [Methanoregulaceae archaeon PtaB.Bin056]